MCSELFRVFPLSPRLARALCPGARERSGPDGKSRGYGANAAVWLALLRAAGDEHRNSPFLSLSGPESTGAGLYVRRGERPSPALSG